MKLYLPGSLSTDGAHIRCPLSSSAMVFVVRYCQVSAFELVFVSDSVNGDNFCCSFRRNKFSDLKVTFMLWNDLPELIRNVLLPSLYQPSLRIVRSGLCVLLRHIIKESNTLAPNLHLIDLLGFRQGSMKMCAEVSGFTKLCEVELPHAVSSLISALRSASSENKQDRRKNGEIVLPSSIIKLENHYQKKCRVHNDDKRRRNELTGMKKYFSDSFEDKISSNAGKDSENEADKDFIIHSYKVDTDHKSGHRCHGDNKTSLDHSTNQSSSVKIEKLSYKNSWLQIDHVTHLHHGIRRMKVDKMFDRGIKSCGTVDGSHHETPDEADLEQFHYVNGENGQLGFSVVNLAKLCELLEKLTFSDIEYEHTYSEGIEMTLADLILYVYVYYLLEALDYNLTSLGHLVPRILRWAGHMTSLSTVTEAGTRCGWNMEKLASCLSNGQDLSGVGHSACDNRNQDVVFVKEAEVIEDPDEMELSRCARMKHKALQPEVAQAIQKFEKASIQPVIGNHPCGDEVQISWSSLPTGLHPREGEVPENRTHRKCQQLENLVTAVQTLAKPGSVLVDFCSGGGHLGIVMAYLLPDCPLYLVENKEESLMRACSRLESLGLSNVTMFQCNLDYFVGTFDVGVCLHACGSATDMVLQLCLDTRASFVICPCCYGSIQKTHLLSYPRSQQFIKAGITYKDFLTLGHAADQTEFNIVLEERGRQCMNLVDTDRAEYARELGYSVTLCSLKPLSCTPKNNLIIGTVSKETDNIYL